MAESRQSRIAAPASWIARELLSHLRPPPSLAMLNRLAPPYQPSPCPPRAVLNRLLSPSCTGRVRACRSDRFIVIASDGVWDVVSDDEAATMLLQHADGCSPTDLAAKLVQTALAKGSRDNISALVVRLV